MITIDENENKIDLDVALASDDGFAMQMGICIMSILETNHDYFERINIHILNNGISNENIEKLISLKNGYKKVNYFFYDVDFIKSVIPRSSRFNSAYHLGFSTYSRLFISKLVDNELSRILYLDSDVMVNDNIFEFYNRDFKNKYCMGVVDISPYYVQKKWDMDDNTLFVNAGVLLINLDKWREENIDDKFIKTLEEFPSTNLVNDQTLINVVFYKKMIISTDLKYNVALNIFEIKYDKFSKLKYLPSEEFSKNLALLFEEAINNPSIIHFTGGFWFRPWEKKSKHPFKNKWLHYKDISPWSEVPLKKYGFMATMKKKIFSYIFVNFPSSIVLLIYKLIFYIRY